MPFLSIRWMTPWQIEGIDAGDLGDIALLPG
jgi:hypothetical protein